MTRKTILRTSGVVLLLFLFGLAGCDFVGSDEDLSSLVGSWRTENLVVDGVSVKAQLDAQYAHLVFTLRESADGQAFFTIVGRENGRDQDFVVQGTFRFDNEDEELTFFPDNAPQIEFDIIRADSLDSELHLSAHEGSSEDRFLDLIQVPIRGAVDRVEIRLGKSAAAHRLVRLPQTSRPIPVA